MGALGLGGNVCTALGYCYCTLGQKRVVLSESMALAGHVVSGRCIGAHNTAVYPALHSLGASTVLISLMAAVSTLPYTLFTLSAGAIADMLDPRKSYCLFNFGIQI